MTDKLEKRRPGRPKLNQSDKVLPVLGVVSEPLNFEKAATEPKLVNVFELIYDNPTSFSKVLEILNKLPIKNIYFYLLHDRMVITSKLAGTESDKDGGIIGITFIGKTMNRYYLKQPMILKVDQNSFLGMLTSNIKGFNSIQLLIDEHSLTTTTKTVKVKLIYDCMSTENILKFKYDVEQGDSIPENVTATFKKLKFADLTFTLSATFLKKCLTDVSSDDNEVKIEYNPVESLKFKYSYGGEEEKETVFQDPIKINIVCNKDRIVACPVKSKLLRLVTNGVSDNDLHLCVNIKHDVGVLLYFDQRIETSKDKKKTKIKGSERIKVEFSLKSANV